MVTLAVILAVLVIWLRRKAQKAAPAPSSDLSAFNWGGPSVYGYGVSGGVSAENDIATAAGSKSSFGQLAVNSGYGSVPAYWVPSYFGPLSNTLNGGLSGPVGGTFGIKVPKTKAQSGIGVPGT